MSISPVSSSSAAYQPVQQGDTRQDFLQLIKSIKSGDLAGAQQAYAAFTQSQTASGAQPDPNSPFAQALSQIGDALKSGNIDQAQQTLAGLQSQIRGGHHHRHHGGGSANASNSTGTATPASDNPLGSTASVSLSINITA
jgi:cellobiose-specific phosphotransferase system component IIA